MMQRLHGSVAKLVNDLLPQRLTPFWRDAEGKGYFDGCIRDEKQAGWRIGTRSRKQCGMESCTIGGCIRTRM